MSEMANFSCIKLSQRKMPPKNYEAVSYFHINHKRLGTTAQKVYIHVYRYINEFVVMQNCYITMKNCYTKSLLCNTFRYTKYMNDAYARTVGLFTVTLCDKDNDRFVSMDTPETELLYHRALDFDHGSATNDNLSIHGLLYSSTLAWPHF